MEGSLQTQANEASLGKDVYTVITYSIELLRFKEYYLVDTQ